jgi:hypothetical protein
MTTPEFDSDEMPTVIVSLNISEATNITMNGTRAKIFEKSIFIYLFIFQLKKSIVILAPNEDASLNNIIIGIGLVAVALVLLVIIIKLIRKCYKECKEDDEDVKDTGMIRKKRLKFYLNIFSKTISFTPIISTGCYSSKIVHS